MSFRDDTGWSPYLLLFNAAEHIEEHEQFWGTEVTNISILQLVTLEDSARLYVRGEYMEQS